ncbi:MAG: DUF2800 domain-containing protein [Clostridia bacterium]|nr:DUF2800 domain-containing protein [Clostridia bacterium]
MPTTHSFLSPSASHRWLSCPPSARLHARLIERLGDQSSEFAAEGTKAHTLSELKLRLANGEINQFRYDAEKKLLEDIPREMEGYTDVYVDAVLERLYAARKVCPDARLFIEQKLDMTPWVPACFGTSDAVIVSDSTLEVLDLKYGKGVPVSAVGNPQARLYALGAVHEFSAIYSFYTVRETIIQPRLDSITEETMPVQGLLAWGEAIKPTAKLAYEGKGEFHSGEWCRFCAAKAICKERATQAMAIFENGFAETPDTIPEESIAGILKVADLAEAWLKDIRQYALAQALKGAIYPGYKLVRGRAPARKWKNEDDVIDQMARAGYSTEQYMEQPKLMSVSVLEKSIGRTAFKALLAGQTIQGDAALTLVPEDDKREEYSSADAAFADLAE